MNNYRVMIDFVAEDAEACRKAAERMSDLIVQELNSNGKNTDEDNFQYQGTRTTYPLCIPNVEEPIVGAAFEEELNPDTHLNPTEEDLQGGL
jgi:hypothetical protein